MPLDVDRLAEAMLAGTQALIAKSLAPLVLANDALAARNADLEMRLAAVESREAPPSIDPAAIVALQDGLAAAVEAIEAREQPDVAEAVRDAVSAAVASLEPPSAPDVAPLVDAAVRAAVAPLVDAAVRAAVAPLVDAAVRAAVEALPPAKDVDGVVARVVEVERALAAIVIPEPIPGAPGVGIAEAKQNADGELILKLTTGETFNVGKVRGEDGLGFEDMSVEWDGDRALTFAFTRDGRTEVTSLKIPAIIDRGVWRDGNYERGDGVTWGGSFWIAQRDTTDKPETSDAWRLSVKRGRDGKDYRPPEDRGGPTRVGVPK